MNGLKAALIKLYLHFCALLPLSWARALGRGLVHLYWPMGGRSVKVTRRNIELVFTDLSEAEQSKLARRSLCATGELVSELGHVWIRPWDYTRGLIQSAEGSELISAAQEKRQVAYCPYSQFRVGASVLCEDGTIFAGNAAMSSY